MKDNTNARNAVRIRERQEADMDGILKMWEERKARMAKAASEKNKKASKTTAKTKKTTKK